MLSCICHLQNSFHDRDVYPTASRDPEMVYGVNFNPRKQLTVNCVRHLEFRAVD